MTYSGRYTVKNIGKYEGDYKNVCFRSLWERQVMRFLDENRDVIKWGSENTVIPYVCPTDRRAHRYFVDFKVTFANGKTVYVEVKPKRETTPPKIPARKTKRFVTEVMTYAKNQAKWKAADRYAQERGASFEVWTEDTIRSLGIKLL